VEQLARQANWNGQQLLDGTFMRSIQVGSNQADQSTV
jgi:flagellin-like hook-associated protein FlgL